jgi:hypothetical protein
MDRYLAENGIGGHVIVNASRPNRMAREHQWR